jgi:site-specific DNA recombinase
MTSLRCALYGRVSLEDQADKYGLASQQRALRQYASDKGYNVAPGMEISDDGWSGEDLDRPGVEALRRAIRGKQIDVVCIYDPDRLSRRLIHQEIVRDEAERAGVRIEYITTPVEKTPEGHMFLQFKGVIAEYEKEKIKERTLRGRREKARQGYIVGGARAFGYRYLGKAEGERGRYEIEPGEAEIVRRMYRLLVEEQISVREIVARLNREGVRPAKGGEWGRSTVHRVLKNELYLGHHYYNVHQRIYSTKNVQPMRRSKKTTLRRRLPSEWISIPVPRIIEQELFDQAQRQLKKNAAHMAGAPAPGKYLLRGLLRCGRCNSPVHGFPSHGRRFYRCAARDRLIPQYCSTGSISADRLERTVWDAIVKILAEPTFLFAKAQAHHQQLAPKVVDQKTEIAQLERTLDDLRGKEARILERLVDADLLEHEQALKSKLKGVTARKLAVRERLSELEDQQRAAAAEHQNQTSVENFCRLAFRGLQALDREGRQKLLRLLVDTITVTGQKIEVSGILPRTAELQINKPEGHTASTDYIVHNDKTLWPPAAATSSARFAVIWPRTSRKSGMVGSSAVKAGEAQAAGRN